MVVGVLDDLREQVCRNGIGSRGCRPVSNSGCIREALARDVTNGVMASGLVEEKANYGGVQLSQTRMVA